MNEIVPEVVTVGVSDGYAMVHCPVLSPFAHVWNFS